MKMRLTGLFFIFVVFGVVPKIAAVEKLVDRGLADESRRG
jgi:hypothetical protein